MSCRLLAAARDALHNAILIDRERQRLAHARVVNGLRVTLNRTK